MEIFEVDDAAGFAGVLAIGWWTGVLTLEVEEVEVADAADFLSTLILAAGALAVDVLAVDVLAAGLANDLLDLAAGSAVALVGSVLPVALVTPVDLVGAVLETFFA